MNPPPFLVSFSDKQALRAALDEDVISLHWSEIERMVARNLPPAVSTRVLACLFGFSPSFVGAMSRRPNRYYRVFQIRKGRKNREIHAPRVSLKVIQSWFGHHLAAVLKFEDVVYGFIAGRSAAQAAAIHCEAQWVYSFDLKDFFQTTSSRMVRQALADEGYSGHAAELVASLCCYRGYLAQGSPASPVLSNLVFRQSDNRLQRLASELGCRYTRYADDLVFSGLGAVPEQLEKQVRAIILDSGWTLADEKIHLAQLPHRLKVHGLLVHGAKPRLTKGYRKRLRAFVHLSKHGKIRDADSARVRGHLAHASAIKNLIT